MSDVKQYIQKRVKNHADDVRLSTLRRYADAVGAHLQIRLAH